MLCRTYVRGIAAGSARAERPGRRRNLHDDAPQRVSGSSSSRIRAAPVIQTSVWYGFGSLQETPGRTGLAHASTHALPRDARDLIGGPRRHHGPPRRTDERRDELRLHAVLFRDARRQARRRALYRGRPNGTRRIARLRMGDRTQSGAQRARRRCQLAVLQYMARVRAAAFPGQPEGRTPLGSRDDVARATAADIARYYREWYAPNNATLVVSATSTTRRSSPKRRATSLRFPQRSCRRNRPQPSAGVRRDRGSGVSPFRSRSSTLPTRFPATHNTGNPRSAPSQRSWKISALPFTRRSWRATSRWRSKRTRTHSSRAACSTSSSYSIPGERVARRSRSFRRRSTRCSEADFRPDLVLAAKRLTMAERFTLPTRSTASGDLAGYTYGIVGGTYRR